MISNITRCTTCGKPLALNETAWACGPMFCSHECGVDWAKTKYASDEYKDETDLQSKATSYFNDIAEEINREDYGARAERMTAYNTINDISTIFEDIYEGDELISTSIIGWYYGSPSVEDDEKFIGKLTALFVE